MSERNILARDPVSDALRRFFSTPQASYVSQQDMRQVGNIAVWAATRRVDRSMPEAKQHGFLVESALNAMRDERRRMKQGARGWSSVVTSVDEVHDGRVDPDTPESLLAVHQAIEAIARMPEQQRTVVQMSVAGCSLQHIADRLGVNASRVSQLRGDIARLLSNYVDTAARRSN